MLYGVCMGTYALISRWGTPKLADGGLQVLSSAIKVPSLLVLTLIVTCPSLYVFNALLGSRLSFASLLRLLTASVGVLAAVLASFGTILVFFSPCTESYAFIIILNVVLFAISGGLGLGFLLQTLRRLANVKVGWPVLIPDADPAVSASPAGEPPANLPAGEPLVGLRTRRREPESVGTVFRVWVIVFGLVGAQMSWVLRPFVLAPHADFAVFRKRDSNFFQAVIHKATDLFAETTATTGNARR